MTGVPFAIMASVTVLLVEVWDRSAPLTAALVGPLVAIALYQRSVHRALEAMRLARTDPLTGLGNPRAFDEQLQRELETARAEGGQLALCMIDVDDFKRINDTHGHATGDSVLAEIAARLRRSGETFRLGGDEFALVLPGCDTETGCAAARSVIERVVAGGYEHGIVPGISAGVAAFPQHAVDSKELVRQADRALYASKRLGKNRVEPCPEDDGRSGELRRLAAGPDRAARLHAAASLAHAVDARDTYTGSHSHAVGQLAGSLAERLGLDPEDVELTRLAGSLHDLGKLAVPEEILRKPGPLNAAERLVLERHPEIGFRMLDSLSIEPVATWVRHHHERWDGGGYPDWAAGRRHSARRADHLRRRRLRRDDERPHVSLRHAAGARARRARALRRVAVRSARRRGDEGRARLGRRPAQRLSAVNAGSRRTSTRCGCRRPGRGS